LGYAREVSNSCKKQKSSFEKLAPFLFIIPIGCLLFTTQVVNDYFNSHPNYAGKFPFFTTHVISMAAGTSVFLLSIIILGTVAVVLGRMSSSIKRKDQ
jgi:hypothetical protein